MQSKNWHFSIYLSKKRKKKIYIDCCWYKAVDRLVEFHNLVDLLLAKFHDDSLPDELDRLLVTRRRSIFRKMKNNWIKLFYRNRSVGFLRRTRTVISCRNRRIDSRSTWFSFFDWRWMKNSFLIFTMRISVWTEKKRQKFILFECFVFLNKQIGIRSLRAKTFRIPGHMLLNWWWRKITNESFRCNTRLSWSRLVNVNNSIDLMFSLRNLIVFNSRCWCGRSP